MSNPITAAWQDIRINEIRSAVQQKNGTIPFLLLPVRLETRFMQVKKNMVSEDISVSFILNFFSSIQIRLIDLSQKRITNTEITQLETDLKSLNTHIVKTIPLPKEKSWYKTLVAEIKEDSASLLRKNSLAGTGLLGSIDVLLKTVEALPVSKEKNLDPSHRVLEHLKSVQQKLATLTDKKKTPFLNVKNKKDLYKYTEKTLNEVSKALQVATGIAKEVKAIHGNQAQRIGEIHKDIRNTLEKLVPSLSMIHQDASWHTFLRNIQSTKIAVVQTEMSLLDRFANNFARLPKPEITLDEKELHFHGIKTLVQLKRFNVSNPLNFKEAKSVQERLSTRTKALDKVIKADQKFTSVASSLAIKNIYSQIKDELSTSKAQVSKYIPKNNSQATGIKVVSEFIDKRAIGSIDNIIKIPTITVTETSETAHELWVRIYPDDIFVHVHEEALSENEISVGKHFWKNWWASTGNADLEKAAFRSLAQEAGIRRAAWIARALDPRKKTENTEALKNKPSRHTLAALASVDKINNSLQTVTQNMLDKTPEQAMGDIQPTIFANYTNYLKSANQSLQPVAFELSFVIQSLHTAITKLGSSLNILIDKRNKLQEGDGQVFENQIQALMEIATEFEQIIGVIKKIEVLPFEVFNMRLEEPFVYPDVAKRDKEWTSPPHSRVLPERFVVVTVQNNKYEHVIVGEKIPDRLQLGINPSSPDENAFHLDDKGDLHIDEKLLWMTEYKEALKVGMAISIPLTQNQAQVGFDQVFVLGLKKETPAQGKQLLGELLQNHIYAPDGMSFLKIGTPTNNTQKDKAGYDPEKDLDAIFDIEIKQVIPAARPHFGTTDGDRLQNALGLSPDIVNKGVGAQHTSVSDAAAMNRALWHATMGHYMEEMWDGIFTYDNIQRAEKFFVDNVSGRGILPSIRIGEQPYGLLTTTAFSQLELYPSSYFPPLTPNELNATPTASVENKLQQRFDLRLLQILQELQKEWQSFPVMHAAVLNEGSAADSYQKNYMNMLGLHATSLAYNVRYGVNVGKGPEFPDEDNTESVATNFSAADSFGPHGVFEKFKTILGQGVYSKSFYYWSEENPSSLPPYKLTDQKYSEILTQMKSNRIFVSRFLETQPELKGALVDKLPSSDALLSNNYINWLLTNGPDQILASNDWTKLPDNSLLFMLLRQSLMQAYQEAALSVMQAENLITEHNRRGLGNTKNYLSFDFEKGKRVFSTKWHYLLKDLDDMVGLQMLDTNNALYNHIIDKSPSRPSLSRYVYVNSSSMLNNSIFTSYPNKANHQKHIAKLDEIRNAFKTLSSISTKDLELLLAEHLDLCTYRLDAWQLGFVNRRLRQHRTASPEGINLGAFGWVENLRPDQNRQVKPHTEIPNKLLPQNQKPVYTDPDNQGFIHGPSIQHGIAAAILRAGYQADRKNNGAGSRLSVNLSSERIRQALSVIEGVRNGLEVGAILGFQFERGLHERYQLGVELDKYIQPFRKKYPLVDPIEDTANNAEPTYQSMVVNGQKLLDEVFLSVDWHQNNTEKTLETLLSENNFSKCPQFITSLTSHSGERMAIIKEIDRIADTLDAVADLVMSEGVYQIVKGNHVRAAAVLASISPNPKTASTIPSPEIIDTPRSGTIVSQRVVMPLPVVDSLQTIAGWENAEPTPRAAAEPSINSWLGKIMGKSSSIGCEVLIKPINEDPQSFFISLDYLAWQPIDYFFFAIDESVLIQKIIWSVRQKESLADETEILPKLKNKVGGRSFYEMDWLIGQFRQLLNGAKPLGDQDFTGIGQSPADSLNTGGHNTVQYVMRAQDAYNALYDLVTEIEDLDAVSDILQNGANPDAVVLTTSEVSKILKILPLLSEYGISNVIPEQLNPEEKSWPALVRKLLAGYKESKKRIVEAQANLSKNLATTPVHQVLEHTNLAFKALFGKAFVALPQFNLSNITIIKKQTDEAYDPTVGILRNGKMLVMEKWLHGIAKVREKLYAIEMLSAGKESLDGAGLNILPAQLSYKEGDYWMGIEYPDSYVPEGDKLSISIVQPEHLGSVCTGILIDDWVEIIPNKSETTGLTFNYNQPNAMPPQSLILAVNPKDNQNWTWDSLLHTLQDTLALSKTRAVEPDHIEQSRYALVLPSIVAEVVPPEVEDDYGSNALGVQVALDFIDNNTK